jgi:hypothetical protein
VSSVVRMFYTTKYFAPGWCTTIAEVDCSADILLRLQQGKQLSLILQIRAGRIAKRIPRSAIFLMKQVAYVRGILPGNTQLFAHLLVVKFGQGLSGLDAQSVEIEIFRVLAALKQPLGLNASLRADRD